MCRRSELPPSAAEEVSLRQNERELGEFGRLELKETQIKPASRAEAHGADAGDQHGNEEKDGHQ